MCMEGPGEGHAAPMLPANSFKSLQNTLQRNPDLMKKVKDHLAGAGSDFEQYKEYFRLLENNLFSQKPMPVRTF